jgi:flagellar biosynthetic protein FlhB
MPETAADKTEQPTPRRIQKAREQGQVPQSQEVASLMTLVAMVAAVTLLAPHLLSWATAELRQGLTATNDVFADRQAFMSFVTVKVTAMLLVMAPILVALVVAGIAGALVVSGPNFSGKALQFKLNAVNPVAGFNRLFNVKSLVRLICSICKLLFVGLVVWFYLKDRIELLAALRWAWSAEIITAIAKLTLGMMIRICVALLVVAVADFAWQKWKYIEDLKMTKQEVKDERKEIEGAPEVKSRIRRIQYEIALRRITQEVPKANVVLVNPTHYAVAIRYDAKTMECPMLVAKGVDYMAEKIREIARAYGVPILRRPELARAIYNSLKPGQAIPPDLYVAVAEILALIYRLKRNRA